jgi:alkylhydroperoxidase family enzyme
VSCELLRDAWESAILSKRAKALVFAVVARALGCKHSESEAARLAAEQGIDAGRLEEILSHLTSPELDPIEAAVVPFARETVWYQPAAIQRRGRELREQLTREQLLELIGVAALANGAARLGFLANPA